VTIVDSCLPDLVQEPSPFSHVSGMKNRFECLIKGLRAAGDEVMVFTPDHQPPTEYHGARVRLPIPALHGVGCHI
jgi:glycogen synthase